MTIDLVFSVYEYCFKVYALGGLHFLNICALGV